MHCNLNTNYSGDRRLVRELERAQDMGVSIHTVFIGYQRFPLILHKLSCSTQGSRFSAYLDAETQSIAIKENTDMPPPEIEAKWLAERDSLRNHHVGAMVEEKGGSHGDHKKRKKSGRVNLT